MRSLQRSRLTVCLLLISAAAYSQESTLDLKQALAAAEFSNLELRAARQQRAVALAGLKIAGQLPNPTISFAGARDLPHESLLWDQPIELGGKRGKRKAVAEEEQKATENDIAILSRQLRHRTREAFYRALLAREQTRQSKAALDLAVKIHDVVQQRFDAGDVADRKSVV